MKAGVPAFVRRPRGLDIYAACGQLKRTVAGSTADQRGYARIKKTALTSTLRFRRLFNTWDLSRLYPGFLYFQTFGCCGLGHLLLNSFFPPRCHPGNKGRHQFFVKAKQMFYPVPVPKKLSPTI